MVVGLESDDDSPQTDAKPEARLQSKMAVSLNVQSVVSEYKCRISCGL